MFRIIKGFLRCDAGAVTVDWVVLTASVVAMAAISFYQLADHAWSIQGAAADEVADQQSTLFPTDE